MNALPVRSFNLNLVNAPLETLLEPGSLSRIFLMALESFPTIQQVTNPVVFLGRPSGGQLHINPAGVFFRDIETEKFDEDLEGFFKIIKTYHSECKILELKELSLRLVFYSKAILSDGRRKLLTYNIEIPDKPFPSLPDSTIHIGLRFIFTVGVNRYDIKIEPRFSNLQENYLDFNVIIPKPIKVEDAFGIINEQRKFFNEYILPVIAR
jgi:hypothetical protein